MRVSIHYHLTASGGADAEVSIYTVLGGYVLKNRQLNIHFPVGTYGELEIYFKSGDTQVMPSKGVYVGDNVMLTDELPAEWDAGSDVVMHYKNANATETREAYILLEGDLE